MNVPPMNKFDHSHIPAPLTVRMVSTSDEWEKLESDWNRLLTQSEQDQIFLSYSWLRCWWDTFGDDKRLCLLVVTNNSTTECIAPFMIADHGRLGRVIRTISFIGTPEIDYAGFIGASSSAVVSAVVDFLLVHRELWDRIDLAQIPEGLPLFQNLVTAFTEHGLPTRTRHADQCLGYCFEGEPSARTTFAIRRGHEVKRLLNFFKGEGGLTVERIASPEAIKNHLDELMHLHISRWQSTPTPSQFCDERYRRFFHALVDRLHPVGQLCFMLSRKGETPVAMSFNYEYKGTIFHYTLAYNPFYTKKSPGNLHVILQSEKLVQAGFDLDFSRGAGPYKKILSNWQRANMQIIVYESGLSRRVADWWEKAKGSSFGRTMTNNRRIMEWKMRLQHRLAERGIVRFPFWMVRALLGRIVRVETIVTFTCRQDQFSPQPGIAVTPSDIGSAEKIATFMGLHLESASYHHLKTDIESGVQFWIATTGAMVGVARRSPVVGSIQSCLSSCMISQLTNSAEALRAIVAHELVTSGEEACSVSVPDGSHLSAVLDELRAERIRVDRSISFFGYTLK